MSKRKASRKFDPKPYSLAKRGLTEAWFYNKPKSIDLVVSDRSKGTTVQLVVMKSVLRKAAALP